MRKFGKGYSVKIMIILLVGVFLSSAITYGFDKTFLRVPLITKNENGNSELNRFLRAKEKQDKSLFTGGQLIYGLVEDFDLIHGLKITEPDEHNPLEDYAYFTNTGISEPRNLKKLITLFGDKSKSREEIFCCFKSSYHFPDTWQPVGFILKPSDENGEILYFSSIRKAGNEIYPLLLSEGELEELKKDLGKQNIINASSYLRASKEADITGADIVGICVNAKNISNWLKDINEDNFSILIAMAVKYNLPIVLIGKTFKDLTSYNKALLEFVDLLEKKEADMLKFLKEKSINFNAGDFKQAIFKQIRPAVSHRIYARLKDARELQLGRKERVGHIFKRLQRYASYMEGFINESDLLETAESLKEWNNKEGDKDVKKVFKLINALTRAYKEIYKKYEGKTKGLDICDVDKYFITLDGKDYFKFNILYDLIDKFNKPIAKVMPLDEDLDKDNIELIEKGVKGFIEGIEIYKILLEYIKSPAREVLDLAENTSESKYEPEYTYEFLAYYYKIVIEDEDIEIQSDLYDKAAETINLILTEANPEAGKRDAEKKTAELLRNLLKDKLAKIKGIKKKDIYKNAKLLQTVVGTIENELEDKLGEEKITITLNSFNISEEDLLIKMEVENRRDSILKNLRIIRTILAAAEPASINDYISAVTISRLNSVNL